jgi:simple sugar transport system ATP-binding protein
MLADNFTVLENIVLGSEPKNGIKLDFAKARKQISEIAAENGLAVDPDVLVSELGVGDRQRIEILKVLYRGAKILILDEPTAVLVPHEVDELFNTLRDLKKEGLTVIFISHKLDEVLSIADEITVIRQGTTVGSVNPHAQNVSARDLAEMMVGNELPTPEAVGDTIQDEVVLNVENLSVFAKGGKAIVDDISFQIRAGEIVGIAGVEGNGQAEILDALMGIESATGRVQFKNEDITNKSTRHRRELGIGFIPEDRHRQALMLEAPLW